MSHGDEGARGTGSFLGITVAELVALLRTRGKRVPFEVGAFITLQAVERVLESPIPLSPDGVRVSDDGMVAVYAAADGDEADVTRTAQGLLAHLLVGAGAAVPPSLLRLVEHGPSDGSGRLARFRDELEASLLPLNRGASQRVLARLVRESRAGGGLSSRPPVVDLNALDADLDALLGDEDGAAGAIASPVPTASPTPTPTPTASPTPTPTPTASSALPDDLAEAGASPVRPRPRPRPVAAVEASAAPSAIPASTLDDLEPAPEPRRLAHDTLDDDYAMTKPRGGARGWVVALVFAGLIAGTAAVVGVLRPDVLARMMGEAPPPPDHSAEEAAHRAEAERRAAEAAGRYGDLVVSVPHERAQILMRVGRGPAVATNLPVGIAHEFVAIADGRAPTRAVVPPDATWEPTNDGPRYELAMQAGEAEVPFEALELGETRLPRDVGSHGNQLGSVRVLTNPPGAEVFLLIGFAPNARVRDLRADQTYELVVWADGFAPRRVLVRPEDFHDGADGKKAANVEITLTPRRPGRR